jgi:hypothetical protein
VILGTEDKAAECHRVVVHDVRLHSHRLRQPDPRELHDLVRWQPHNAEQRVERHRRHAARIPADAFGSINAASSIASAWRVSKARLATTHRRH